MLRLYEEKTNSGHNRRIWHLLSGVIKLGLRNNRKQFARGLNGTPVFTIISSGMKTNTVASIIISETTHRDGKRTNFSGRNKHVETQHFASIHHSNYATMTVETQYFAFIHQPNDTTVAAETQYFASDHNPDGMDAGIETQNVGVGTRIETQNVGVGTRIETQNVASLRKKFIILFL